MYLKLIAAVLLFTGIDIVSQIQFLRPTNGPYGGLINSMIFIGDTIFAGGSGGVFRSVDKAGLWVYAGLGNTNINALAYNRKYIYAATSNGLYRSHDGLNWVIMLTGSFSTVAVVGSVVMTNSEYYGVNRSSDWGDNWALIQPGIDTQVRNFLICNDSTFLTYGFGFSTSGIFRSTDSGLSWYKTNPDTFTWDVECMYKYKNKIYASDFVNFAKVYISSDNGISWYLPFGANNPNDIIQSLYVDSTGIYAALSYSGVYKSFNDGIGWDYIGYGLRDKNVGNLFGAGSSIYATAYDGISRLTGLSKSWNYCNNGLNNSRITKLVNVENTLFAGTSGLGLLRSGDLGTTWTNVNLEIENKYYIYDILYYNKSLYVIAALTFGESFAVVLKSNDLGRTWSNAGDGLEGLMKCFAAGNDFILIGSEFGIFKSTNGGLQWNKKIMDNLPDREPNIGSAAVIGQVALASDGSSGVYRSSDAGETWTFISIPGIHSAGKLNSIGNKIYLGSSEIMELFFSSDSGKNWKGIPAIPIDGYVTDIAGAGDTIALTSSRDGLILSTDNGAGWDHINAGLNSTGCNTLCFHKGKIFIGTEANGAAELVSSNVEVKLLYPLDNSVSNPKNIHFVWSGSSLTDKYRLQISRYLDFHINEIDIFLLDTSYTTGNLKENQRYYWRVSPVISNAAANFTGIYSLSTAPGRYIIWNNYPNPFNSSTVIKYGLPQNSRIRIEVYNVLGEKIKTLVDDIKNPGNYEVSFDGSNLSSGIYIYRLTANSFETGESFVKSTKMLLIK